MNSTILKAIELSNNMITFPDLKIGDICDLSDVIKGNEKAHVNLLDHSIGHRADGYDWLFYSFDIINDDSEPLDWIVKITNIELI